MDIEKGVKEYLEKIGSVDRKDIIEHDFREGINWTLSQLKVNSLEARVSEIFADFENLLVNVMGSRKCSIGSLENYYDLHLEVKRINELYSKIQEYHTVSQNSR